MKNFLNLTIDEYNLIRTTHVRLLSQVKRGPIEKVIPQLVEVHKTVYGFANASEINDGGCWDFADDILIFFPKGELKNNQNFVEKEDDWDHAFVLYNGRYYDSETPEGVMDWKNLPCCKACLVHYK